MTNVLALTNLSSTVTTTASGKCQSDKFRMFCTRSEARPKTGTELSVAVQVGFAIMVAGCGSQNAPPNPPVENGWVTNCMGEDFKQIPQVKNTEASHMLPIFKISDRLVLAVPTANSPAASVKKQPDECHAFSDLPKANFVTFVVSGDWSSVNKASDVPIVDGKKQFQPDLVSVRIEPEAVDSPEEEDRQKSLRESAPQGYAKEYSIGSLACFAWGGGWAGCFGRSTEKPDFIRLRYRAYNATPFVLVLANYPSLRYGGVHVYWSVWLSDVSYIPMVDAAVWKTIEGWNVVSVKKSQTGRN